MRLPYGFDPSTSCHDRSLREIWLPYTFPEDERDRDAIWGRTLLEHEQSLEREHCKSAPVSEAVLATQVITRKRFNEAYNSVCFANFLGSTMNVQLTVDWEEIGHHGKDADHAFKSFLDLMKR